MIRKGISVLLGIFLIFSFSIPTSIQASTEEDLTGITQNMIVSPAWQNIGLFSHYFDISSGGEANITITFAANGATQLKVGAYLQQYNNGSWITVKTWETTSAGTSCNLNVYRYVTPGYSYRSIAIGTVYNNGVQIEQAGNVSPEKYY